MQKQPYSTQFKKLLKKYSYLYYYDKHKQTIKQ